MRVRNAFDRIERDLELSLKLLALVTSSDWHYILNLLFDGSSILCKKMKK